MKTATFNKQSIFKTGDSFGPLLLRVAAGLVMLVHGSQKVFGTFGGYGFSGTMNFFTETMHLPWLIALLVIAIEFFGSIALILGLTTRLAAFGITAVALGIVITSHIQYGFFMNWYGSQKGEGIEYFILYIAISASLVITGGGKFSVDRLIQR
ncbi:DoxX family protein [Mucilaginibacter calamicampi]|uniref:DoxX family protein n=1 Tax=Mucilaginibacter calamicampi TaxID=1302352 RepID=A0ABW2YVZ9_9SPHI